MLEIVYKPVGDLTAYGNNPMVHSDKQIAELVGSIQEFGFTNPILIDDSGVIIAGHGRLEAAELAGLTEVPTVMLSHLSDDQRDAYRIADNKLPQNAGWNIERLREEFEKLAQTSIDIDLLGFSQAEMKKVLEAGSGEGGGGGGLGDPIIKYEIIFDDEAQQETWFAFLRAINAEFPEDDTIGARLQSHIQGIAGLVTDGPV